MDEAVCPTCGQPLLKVDVEEEATEPFAGFQEVYFQQRLRAIKAEVARERARWSEMVC